MKQLGNKQWQRKSKSLLASLLYRLTQGPVETEPFATLLQQIFDERIKANPVNADTLNNSLAQVQLFKIPNAKRSRRKFAQSLTLQQQREKDQEQPSDHAPLTIGQIVNGWAGLTGQDERVFALKVCSKIQNLLAKQYTTTGHLGFTDGQAHENPESAFTFMADLFKILIEATPADKKDFLIKQMKATLITSGKQSAAEVNNELLQGASTMLTVEIVTQLSEALSHNPPAKDRLLHPVFGELMAIEARRYGWDSGVPADNDTQLKSALSQDGVSPSKRMTSRSLKKLGRKNILQNVDDALHGSLIENLNNIISKQTAIEQSKTQSIWEFSPVSPGDTAETEKRIRAWLFRRDNNDTSRNHHRRTAR